MKGWIYLFVLLFLVSFVVAGNGCCPLTLQGDSCVYTTDSNCADGFVSGALCEQTDVCRTGCCVSSEGCFEQTGEYTCSLNSGDFFYDQVCSTLEACEMTCCKFGSDYSFMSSSECSSLINEYGSDLVQSFSADDEAACEELEDQEQKGCCVSNLGCAYVTQAECGYSSYNTEGFGFFENEYCDGVAKYLDENNYVAEDYCACEVAGNVCDEDRMYVYELDSCGNYGKVVEECDFPDEMCIEDSNGVYCGTGECSFSLPSDLVKYNPLWENDFQNYESRCLYEGPAGNYQDRPGSRHYIMRCVVGELILEPCDDYRETVCVDNYDNGIDAAECVSNSVDSEADEVTTVPKGEKFWEYYTTGGVSDRCSKAVVNCNVVFGEGAKIGWDYDYECDANCFCLRKEWSKLMNEYCNAQGDCGNNINLVGELSDDSFFMNREKEEINGENAESISWETQIGCGEMCITREDSEREHADNDAVGLQCYPGGSIGECKFYSWEEFDDHYSGDLNYKESLLSRGTEAVYFFTLFEYAGVTPNFFNFATEYVGVIYEQDLMGGLLSLFTGGLSLVLGTEINDNSEAFFEINLFDHNGAQEIGVYALNFISENWIYYFPFESNQLMHSYIPEYNPELNYDLAKYGTTVEEKFPDFKPETYEEALYYYLAYHKDESWIESINNYREEYGYSKLNWNDEVNYIVGEKVLLDDIIDPIAKAPEYDSKVTYISVNVAPTCGSWVAPVIEDCELCNTPLSEGGIAIDDGHGNIFAGYGCSEYRCKALGKNCEWIAENDGTDRPSCISLPVDNTPPQITLWKEKMDELNYDYKELEDGVEIYEVAVGKIQMPVLTDDYSQCKISDDPANFQLAVSSAEFFGALNYISQEPILGFGLEHNFTYVLTEGGKEYTFWIYCNNYYNLPIRVPYEFSVTTTALPDTDAPEIEGIDPSSGSYVKSDEESVVLDVYLNENAYCKYSSQDIEYAQMTSEFASCAESDGIFSYVCITTVPLNSGTTNLYILCSDVAGNVMTKAEHWYVSESPLLNITQYSPSGTLFTNEIVLQVYTEGGVSNGQAVCYYEGSGTSKQKLFITDGKYHEQTLNLEKGSYSYTISCEDSIGNVDSEIISFIVDKDESAAEITGVYYLGTNVYVLTNEATSCQYKTESFSYGNGYDMGGVASTAHSFTVSDLTQIYYINCIDAYSNKLEGVKIDLNYLL